MELYRRRIDGRSKTGDEADRVKKVEEIERICAWQPYAPSGTKCIAWGAAASSPTKSCESSYVKSIFSRRGTHLRDDDQRASGAAQLIGHAQPLCRCSIPLSNDKTFRNFKNYTLIFGLESSVGLIKKVSQGDAYVARAVRRNPRIGCSSSITQAGDGTGDGSAQPLQIELRRTTFAGYSAPVGWGRLRLLAASPNCLGRSGLWTTSVDLVVAVKIEPLLHATVALGGPSTTRDHFRIKPSELVPTGSPPIHHGRERTAPFLTCSVPRERS